MFCFNLTKLNELTHYTEVEAAVALRLVHGPAPAPFPVTASEVGKSTTVAFVLEAGASWIASVRNLEAARSETRIAKKTTDVPVMIVDTFRRKITIISLTMTSRVTVLLFVQESTGRAGETDGLGEGRYVYYQFSYPCVCFYLRFCFRFVLL